MSTRLPTRVWHLVMNDPEDLRPARRPGPGVVVARTEVPLGAINRFFYSEIGREHHWVDRLSWDAASWQGYAAQPSLETWLVHDRGTPAGYAELDTRRAYVAMFGILPGMQGRGLGAHLLEQVVRRAWQLEPRRVTLDTCELDSPHALRNYLGRGFEVMEVALEPRGRMPAA